MSTETKSDAKRRRPTKSAPKRHRRSVVTYLQVIVLVFVGVGAFAGGTEQGAFVTAGVLFWIWAALLFIAEDVICVLRDIRANLERLNGGDGD